MIIRRNSFIAVLLYLFVFVGMVYISFVKLNTECDCRNVAKTPRNVQQILEPDTHIKKPSPTKVQESRAEESEKEKSPKEEEDDKSWGPHVLGVVVPYRNRFEELLRFAPHMHKFLNEKKIRHKIYIANQVDKYRFNRASLLNVGFLAARNDNCDYFVMHDVDLLPLNKKLFYGYPEKGPFHISAPHLHPKYHYRTFVGGILMMSVEHFEKVNGLSNRFWGWGREDDELYQRIMGAGLTIYRHSKKSITTGYNTFEHDHDPKVRPRDYSRVFGQREASFRRDKKTGINNIEYEITSRKEMTIDGAPLTILNVELECDIEETPWCQEVKKKKS